MKTVTGIFGRVVALALLAGALVVLPARVDAAPTDHSHHAAEHAIPADMTGHNSCDDCGDRVPSGHAGCHCVSAPCAQILPPQAGALTARPVIARPSWPPIQDVQPLASVDPPSKPPRV